MKTFTLLLLTTAILFGISCTTTPESKYAHATTAELKLRRQQLVDQLQGGGQQINVFWRPTPFGIGSGDGDRKKAFEEKEELERELLRRWQNGDSDAFLPAFK